MWKVVYVVAEITSAVEHAHKLVVKQTSGVSMIGVSSGCLLHKSSCQNIAWTKVYHSTL